MHPFKTREADTANMRRANTLLVAVAFVMLLGAGMASLLLVARAKQNAAAVADTIGIRVEFHTIFSLIQDTETGQRGFLLTRDPAYLDPYYTARLEIDRKLAALEQRLADRPIQLQNVKALHDVARKRIEILDRTIALAGAGDFEGAIAEVANNRGQVLMDEGRHIVERALDEEAAVLVGREGTMANSYALLSVSIIGAIAAAFVLAILSIRLTRRAFVSMVTRKEELARLNEELEARVQDRTRELEKARERAEAEANRAEYERGRVELLLREVTHRVGNNLAMVSSLLRMQQAKLDDNGARAALETARGRIQTISTAQRRLRLDDDLQSTRADLLLEAVVSDLVDAGLDDSAITLCGNFEPLVVSSRDATTLAVVLGELVSNAIKHAFDGRDGGTISVSFTMSGDVPVMAVEDDGVGFDETDRSSARRVGLGSMIVENLSRQYGGEIRKWKNEAGGTSVHILLTRLKIVGAENAALFRKPKSG